MNSKGMLVALCGAALMMVVGGKGTAEAGGRLHGNSYGDYRYVEHGKYRRKRGPRVRGFLQRRGGYYSYTDQDVINTYEGSRTLFGGTNAYRDPYVDRQTQAGPFDHGFFFDSGVAPRGGDAPYLK